jgi:lipoprotein signal peptidase
VRKKENLNLGVWILIFGLAFLGHNFIAERSFLFENYGFSFSWESPNTLLVNIIFAIFLGYFYIKERKWSLGLLLIGGLINLIDRWGLGYVRDYWSFGIIVNNLADWLIGIGILLFLVGLWKKN